MTLKCAGRIWTFDGKGSPSPWPAWRSTDAQGKNVAQVRKRSPRPDRPWQWLTANETGFATTKTAAMKAAMRSIRAATLASEEGQGR